MLSARQKKASRKECSTPRRAGALTTAQYQPRSVRQLFIWVLILFVVASHALIHWCAPQLAAVAAAGRGAASRLVPERGTRPWIHSLSGREAASSAASLQAPALPPSEELSSSTSTAGTPTHGARDDGAVEPPASDTAPSDAPSDAALSAEGTGAGAGTDADADVGAASAEELAAAAVAGCPGRQQTVLLIHEHHLKSIGSDLRLLGLLLQLRGLGHSVSLLFRGPVPLAQRSPPTQELAALIGASETGAQRLSQEVSPRPPPAIYEHSDLAALAALARHGWFDLIFCTFWFWRDPAPSSAELFLPTLAMHAPPNRRPWVMILSDDAHSAKATMMSEWEKDPDRQRLWTAKAASLPARQQAVYGLAEGVVHISDADSRLERATFNASCARWFTLRMSPRGFGRTTNATDATDATEDAAAEQGVSPVADSRAVCAMMRPL
jgi:hypothetical protein